MFQNEQRATKVAFLVLLLVEINLGPFAQLISLRTDNNSLNNIKAEVSHLTH